MEYLEYTTKDNDRWDLIAWEYYGDQYLYEPILNANPNVPKTPLLFAGLKLLIPVIPVKENDGGLPPWKR